MRTSELPTRHVVAQTTPASATCPPHWLPGLFAVGGGVVGSWIGDLGQSATQRGLATLLGSVIGLGASYIVLYHSTTEPRTMKGQ